MAQQSVTPQFYQNPYLQVGSVCKSIRQKQQQRQKQIYKQDTDSLG